MPSDPLPVAPADRPAAPAEHEALQRMLCPTGALRFGVVEAPEPTSFFVALGSDGQPRGVTVDLGRDLARALGVSVVFVAVPNSGQLVRGLADGAIDAAFMPVDDARRAQVDFGPAYTSAQNTYLVRGSAGIVDLASVDRPGVRVIGIAETTTIRSAAGLLRHAAIEPVASVAEALDRLDRGSADALALTRDTLETLLPRVPGGVILAQNFRELQIAIAVPRERAGGLAAVSAWLVQAKADGRVRRVLDAAGLPTVPVAP